MLADRTSLLMRAILLRKRQIEEEGKVPRLVLLSPAALAMLKEDWFDALGDMPGGEDMVESMSMRDRMKNRVSGDGILFDLVVFGIDTMTGEFEVR
jgi:hypothetical protein